MPLCVYVSRTLEPGGVSGCLDKTRLGLGKDFTWSKRLGFELSPLKTRSARKKAELTPLPEVNLTTLTDLGALGGMKALARAKP